MEIFLPTRNVLLSMLPPEQLRLIEPHLELVEVDIRHVLEHPHETIGHIYFPVSGLMSIVAKTEAGMCIEVGIFGREGMSGTSLATNDLQTPFMCYAQIAGTALRMTTSDFLSILRHAPALHSLLCKYNRAASIQTAYTALVNGKVKLEGRLARWLLMVDDRVADHNFKITHDFLSIMLGVHRPGVTLALQILEGHYCIKSERGRITIRDRDGLLAFAGKNYGASEAEYLRIFGQDFRNSL
jgi:CRP-like cAMP-binding protein